MLQQFNSTYIPVSTILGDEGATKTKNTCALNSKNLQSCKKWINMQTISLVSRLWLSLLQNYKQGYIIIGEERLIPIEGS